MSISKSQKIKFAIITTERLVYEKEIKQVTVPTKTGTITILPRHIPLVSTLSTGAIKVKDLENNEHLFSVHNGIVEVNQDSEVTILAGKTEPVDEIDLKRAEEAYERAKKYLEEKNNESDVDYARLQATLEKNLNRINLVRAYRKQNK